MEVSSSLVLPMGFAFFQEGGDALLSVLFQEVVHHHLLGHCVGGGPVHFKLPVEGRFSQGQGA